MQSQCTGYIMVTLFMFRGWDIKRKLADSGYNQTKNWDASYLVQRHCHRSKLEHMASLRGLLNHPAGAGGLPQMLWEYAGWYFGVYVHVHLLRPGGRVGGAQWGAWLIHRAPPPPPTSEEFS